MFENKQITQQILMVRPAQFAFNAQTATNNAFQQSDEGSDPEIISLQAIAEFDAFVAKLHAAGVQVHVAQDSLQPAKPDAVFPNNWITFHNDLNRGAIFLYPMFAPSRRIERDPAVIASVASHFKIWRQFDFSTNELNNEMVEGTGSMILDRVNGIIYACVSPRTTPKLLGHIAAQMSFSTCVFESTDQNGQQIYHTNVMMALGETVCVICLDSIKNDNERAQVVQQLTQTGKAIVEISITQMNQFAGNMLQVQGANGPIMVMSSQAYESLNTAQIDAISAHCAILHSDIRTIETYGGGSARCMMAEIFLPKV